ncbi:MAG: 3-hydroxy-3-methylglutaryl-CoA reductase, partial [Halobacteria archaeon]|nr:3-hydroxy-3-methylglutaryl-CoA reductase [Halobacteria archaeon]
ALEEWTGANLDTIGNYDLDTERATDRNVENMVGAVQIPLGVAGPLEVNGEYAEGDYYVPLATTEGALVASTNRGCSAITSSGGANVRIFDDAMTRAPAFRVEDVKHAHEVVEWVDENFERLKEAAEETTNHGELLWIDPYVTGDSLYLRFGYDTKDAMGMNMATVAINAIEGRGKTVSADVMIPRNYVEETLKTTPEAIAEVNNRKTLVGSMRAGTLGGNAHAANVIASMYLATGQDEAHVVEGSSAITTASVRDDDLYA